MTDVAGYRASLRRILAADGDRVRTWKGDLVDEALRSSLVTVAFETPAVESSLTVVTAGREQDISSVSALDILSVMWPWYDSGGPAVGWRWVSDDVIWIEDGEPQVGDVIRLRYRRSYSIAGLDGAVSTTVPAAWERLVLEGAAWWAYDLLLRRRSSSPAATEAELSGIRDLSSVHRASFESWAQRLGGAVGNPSWSDIGL